MTDGIIQEVFNLRINARRIKPVEREILECMKQELIEKIKQDFQQFNSWDRDLIYRILTGDNEE